MAESGRQQTIRSFSDLGDFLAFHCEKEKTKRKHASVKGFESSSLVSENTLDMVKVLPADCDDGSLFRKAMEDVIPMPSTGRWKRKRQKIKKGLFQDHAAHAVLRELISSGKGFVVSQTPEYMEGRGYGVSPALVRRLHNGDFSVQAHIDLHGHGVQDACQAVDAFLAEAIGQRRRVVLVIHGRGLSSARRPVLKEKMRDWLSTGRWRKWVLAFASARAEDGGAGATYVMLRSRPVTKSQRRGCSFVKQEF